MSTASVKLDSFSETGRNEMVQSLKYTNAPYGQRPVQRPTIPQHARPLSEAPTNSSKPIRYWDPKTGENGWATHYKSAWNHLAPQRDPYSGRVYWRMCGKIIHDPSTRWTSS